MKYILSILAILLLSSWNTILIADLKTSEAPGEIPEVFVDACEQELRNHCSEHYKNPISSKEGRNDVEARGECIKRNSNKFSQTCSDRFAESENLFESNRRNSRKLN